MTSDELKYHLPIVSVGSFITFAPWPKKPYRVRARSGRFIVCTRPYKDTVHYTVIDLVERIRGTENLVLGLGAESDQDCWDMVDRLDGRDNNHPQGKDAMKKPLFEAEKRKLKLDYGFQCSFRTEISHRCRVDLDVIDIRIPKSCKPW